MSFNKDRLPKRNPIKDRQAIEQAAIAAFAKRLTEGKDAPIKHSEFVICDVDPTPHTRGIDCKNPVCSNKSTCPACAIRKAANLGEK